jgi:hypothetical protein
MPNLTVEKALKKFAIVYDLKLDRTRVFYAWDKSIPKMSNGYPIYNFFMVDYNEQKREWYINYVTTDLNVLSCTIDDVTGTTYMNTYDE